jgi:hypothetical protein
MTTTDNSIKQQILEVSNSVAVAPPSQSIIDTGTSAHCMLRSRDVANIQAVTDGVTVFTPCGASMQSEAAADLVLPHIS